MEIYFDGTLIDSDNYISFTNEFKQFDESFMLGTTASNTITIEVPGNISIPTNVLIKINNSNYSTMIVDSYEYEDNNILKLNLVDKMVLLDFNYNAKSLVPCTVKQILQDICTQAGITLATTTFTNQNLSVDYYDNTITAREYVGMIAELNGGFARINTSGALELVKFTGTPTNIDIDTCEDFRVGEKHKIERVVFDNGLLKFETSSDETKETLYLNSQNVYINDETTFNNIANQILNFEFYCFSTGNCEIKSNVRAGDLLNFTDGTNNYPTIAQYSLNYVGGLNGGYELNINSKKQEETKIVGVGEQYKRLSVKIDRDKNEILETVESQISGVEKEINPTSTSSCSSIYLEDSAETELIDFEVEGKTEQETRSGKNKYNINNNVKNNTSVEMSINDNTLTLTATGTTGAQYARCDISNLDSSKSYTLSLKGKKIVAGTDGQPYIRLVIQGSSNGSSYTTINGSIKTITNPTVNTEYSLDATVTGYSYYRILIYNNCNSPVTVGEKTQYYNIQFEEGTTATEYEQYGATPSPDYPSELVSVGYENLLPNNATTETISGITFTKNSDGTIIANGTATALITYNLFENIILDAGTYLFSGCANGGSSSTYDLRLNSEGQVKDYGNGTMFKISSSTTYERGRIVVRNGATLNNVIFKPMVTKGTQAHSYIPYGKYGVEVKTIGKNLFDGEIELGSINPANGELQTNNARTRSKNYIKVKPNTTYSYTRTAGHNRWIVGYTSNKEGITDGRASGQASGVYLAAQSTLKFSFTTTATTEYIKWYDTGSTYLTEEVMIEENTQATEYEPYKSNTYLYTLDNPLRSIDDTKDLLYIKNGMFYVDRKIGSVILDENSNIIDGNVGGSFGNTYRYYVSIDDIKQSTVNHANIISDYFNGDISVFGSNEASEGEMGVYRNTNRLYFTLTQSNVTNTKNWLSTHNTEVQYILAEPYTEELGEVQIPSTYKGITHIDTTDELEPNMNITYVRDTLIANYVESHVSELKINEQGIEARVETIEESDYGGKINRLESSITSQEARLDVISTNIDTTTGEVREVTTSNGLKFNSDGLNLYTGQDSYNTLINNVGTYYKDGDNVISETTKDGFMATNSKNKGQHSYSYDETNDLYEFIDERVEADGEYCYATFYNGEE